MRMKWDGQKKEINAENPSHGKRIEVIGHKNSENLSTARDYKALRVALQEEQVLK